ncbi:MAG: TenA family protein [Candidatus Thermoplasmatota archaeon]|jgi:thiaminase/transcriptional activator TenA|nr:TenA family protein [Candidatus Thermoplasmatota archaeon]
MNKNIISEISDIQSAIMKHPFILGLRNGTLPEKNFIYYVIQDTLYLKEYSRILMLVGERMSSADHRNFLIKQSKIVMEVEMGELHFRFLSGKGIDPDGQEMSFTTSAYTDHMYKHATSGTELQAILSVLPCYLIYLDVADNIEASQGIPEEYATWIKEYSSDRYRKSVERISGIVDEFIDINGFSESDRKILRKSAIFEYLFWETAMKMEKPPFRL